MNILLQLQTFILSRTRGLKASLSTLCLLVGAHSGAYYLHEEVTPLVKYLQPVTVDESIPSGVEGIDCCYLINLNFRTARYEQCQNLFKAKGLFVNRFSAIYGWGLSEESNELFGNYPIQQMGRGHLGCILSHLSIIQDALQRDFERIWIMEDDVNIISKIHHLTGILERLDRVDPDWDIYFTDPDSPGASFSNLTQSQLNYLSRRFLRPDQPTDLFRPTAVRHAVDIDIMTTGHRWGTHSYIISRKGLKKLWHHYTHAYLYDCYDGDMHFIDTIREYSCPRRITGVRDTGISDTANLPTLDLTSSLNNAP